MTRPETSTDGDDELLRASLAERGKSEILEPTGFVDPKTIGLQDDGAVALRRQRGRRY